MRKILAVTLLGMMSAVWGHEPMSHACVAPERPVDDQNDELWQQFMADIDTFRDCVNDKMEWHQAAADLHLQNAREVVALWNEFVKTSLNAPEDFPWPEQPSPDGN